MTGHQANNKPPNAQDEPETGLRRRGRRKRRDKAVAIAITPLVDIVFLLLLYFMLAGAVGLPVRSFNASAPDDAGRAARQSANNQVRVLVDSGPQGCVLVSDAAGLRDAKTLDAFQIALGTAIRSGRIAYDDAVAVRFAETARWEDGLAVVAALRRAGLHKISLPVPKVGPDQTPAPGDF